MNPNHRRLCDLIGAGFIAALPTPPGKINRHRTLEHQAANLMQSTMRNRRLPLFFVDEVAASIVTGEDAAEAINITPLARPPFKETWIEFTAGGTDHHFIGAGAHCWTVNHKADLKPHSNIDPPPEGFTDLNFMVFANCNPNLLTEEPNLRRAGGVALGPLAFVRIRVEDSTGQAVKIPNAVRKDDPEADDKSIAKDGFEFIPGCDKALVHYVTSTEPIMGAALLQTAALTAAVCIKTFGLLNCRNITTYSPPPLNRDVSQRVAQQQKRGQYRYQVLRLNTPLKSSRSAPNRGEAQGGGLPLHVVRGHFRDYTQGGGLFGKLHGVYFVDSFARGDAKEGTIDKDYKIEHHI